MGPAQPARGRALLGRWAGLLGALCAAGLLLLTGTARADLALCPTAPPDYTGTDDAAAQVNAERAAIASSCQAVAERLDAVAARTDAVTAKLASVGLDPDHNAVAITGQPTVGLAAGSEVAIAGRGTDSDSPLFFEQTNASGSDVATLEDVYIGLHGDVWFIAGLIAGLFGAYALYRQVMPRA
jgi:hypothetical protein